MRKPLRIELRIPKWWGVLNAWCERNHIAVERSEAYDDLFGLILDAISEDKAAELGSLGGLKGGLRGPVVYRLPRVPVHL